jgi:hypothetical protein
MTVRSPKKFGYIFCLFIVILYAKVISAYVLQGPHIIELMTEKLGEAESLFVSQKVVFYIIPPQPESPGENEGVEDATAAANPPDNQQATPPSEETDVLQPDSLIESDSSDDVKDSANPPDNQQATPPSEETDVLQPDFLIESDNPDDVKDSANPPDDQQALPDQSAFDSVKTETIQLDESLRYVFSEAFRADSVSDNNQRIYVFRDGQTLTVIDGVISNDAGTRFDLYKDLLLFRSREVLSERLSDLGVDISVSSLGKFEGQPAFVVGAEYPDETLPQVWIDMGTFQPVRMIIPSGSASYSTDFLEIRYSQWQKIGKIWYPMRIEFVQDGTTVRTIEVNGYQVDPNFSKDVFDIARLRSEYRQPIQTPDRAGEGDGLSEVQETIERFKKIFE